MTTATTSRCSLCGQYVASSDREAMLEAQRWEWAEALVDEARTDGHVCIDRDPCGAAMLGRLADSGAVRPELRDLIAGALGRKQAAGPAAWTMFTTCTKGATLADQYQQDRDALERLQEELANRKITAEIVVPDLGRPFPALNVYRPDRTYAVHSVWFYDAGDRLPGSYHHGKTTPIPVYVWGGHFEHTNDARQPELAAERIAQDVRS
jgi:hypothetical protein